MSNTATRSIIEGIASGDLPDTRTYTDRRWAFIGRTEPADGVLIVQQYRGSRAEVDRYRVEEQPKPVGVMGRAFLVVKKEREPGGTEDLRDMAKRPVENIYQTVIGPVCFCNCKAANTRCSDSCKHRDSIGAMIAGGVL